MSSLSNASESKCCKDCKINQSCRSMDKDNGGVEQQWLHPGERLTINIPAKQPAPRKFLL